MLRWRSWRAGHTSRVAGGGNLFFQPFNARYEKGAMILTSNRGFAEWGEVFGDPVRATGSVNQSTFDFKARAYHRVQASPVTCQPFRYRTPSGDLE
jgi:hypothetical protein